ncbi:uncharacterized protein [Nicotiana sylvestris]|uniref:uncharacterized protein n=1 Tax=Nicotiana sylvestris TaxID=4096 RepID=UPI00388CA047
MRSAPPGEEAAPKPAKDKKRRRASPSDTQKPKKSKARKPKNDSAALSVVVAQNQRDEEEEGEDAGCELATRKRGSVEASKAVEPITVEEAHPQTEEISEGAPSKVVTLHREAFTKSQAELNWCEADLKRLTEERDTLKRLYVQKEEEIRDLRVELAIAHKKQTNLIKQNVDRLASEKDTARAQLSFVERQLQSIREESLARAKKIEQLETRLAVELAKAASVAKKAKANAEAIVAVYRADAKASNARAKEIFDAAQVRLSRAVEHAKCQSRRETLEKVHARGFDHTAVIKNAKVLEAEAEALLSDDDDSGIVSGSESGED